MKPYRSLWVSLALCTLLVANAAAAGIDGRYAGVFNGQPAAAELETQGGRINGTLVIGGYTYRIAARAAGTDAEGELTDEEGIAIPLALQASGDSLRLQIFMHGDGAPVELALQRGGSGSAAPAEAQVERDPVLVGAWVKSESYTSGDFSMVDQKTVQLLPDGRLVIGPARLIGGGDAGSFDSGSGGGGGGEWRTADRILYTREPGTGWAPYGRYYVEGTRMMVTFGDGSREVWSRR